MTTDEAIKFFTREGLFKVLNLRAGRQTLAAWGKRPPMVRQYEIECKSCGYLLADDFHERRKLTPPKPHPYDALEVIDAEDYAAELPAPEGAEEAVQNV